MNPILRANIAALGKHPHLVKLAEHFSLQVPDPLYQVVSARNQQPTLVVQQSDGKSVLYHSRYDPQAEAKKLVAMALQDQTNVLILGLGFGYLLSEAFLRLPKTGFPHQIVVIEPDTRVFFMALSEVDFQPLLNDSRIDWCIGMTPDEVGEMWHTSLDWASLDQLAIIEHPPSLQRFPDYFERIKEKVRYFCQRSKGNLVTLMRSGTDFLTNNFLNLGCIAEIPGVGRLFDRFQNIPAIVVAAGPSLEKNVHLLQEVKGKFLIIAVDTAFRQLVARGIRPDIVCAADPSYLNSLDFVGVENEDEVILVFEPMVHPDIIHSFKGPKLITSFGSGLSSWLTRFREDMGMLTCWGSIATTAFDMARKFGCNPITFIGLDLSFEDGKLYARGSYSDDVFFDQVHHLTSLEHETLDYIATKGVHQFPLPDGKVLYTDQNMNLYRSWFEDQFQQTPQTVINATEGGLVKQHAKTMTLREVIDTHLPSAGPIRDMLNQALKAPLQVDRQGLETTLTKTLGELKSDERRAQQGRTLCQKLRQSSEQTAFSTLSGPEKVRFQDALTIHDSLCQNPIIFSWFTVNQTRFVTRHTQEIIALKKRSDATVGEWCAEVKDFFEKILEYHEYQIPLLEAGLQSILVGPKLQTISCQG